MKNRLVLIFCSSISSQLGYLVYLRSLKDQGAKNTFKLLIVTPPSSSLNHGLRVFESIEFLRFKKIVVLHRISKIIFFLFVRFLLALKALRVLPFKVEIIEPRPNWHESLIGERVISSIRKKIPWKRSYCAKYLEADKYIYYGDGLSQFCPDVKPFWLAPPLSQTQRFLPSAKRESYCAFDTYSSGENRNFNRISIKSVKETLDLVYSMELKMGGWLEDLESRLLVEKQSGVLIVLSGTTLSKTGRSSLNTEVSLYTSYLNELLNRFSQKVDLIYKPHPGSSSDFNEQIKLSLNKFRNVTLLDLPGLVQIPLEFLLRACEKHYECKEINLIALSSGAIFSSFSLRNSINVHLGFGEELVKKYLNTHYSELRLQQEKMLASLLNEYID